MFYSPKELQKLIQQLSKTEKSYFKKYGGFEESDAAIILYNHLEKDKEFSEIEFDKHLKKVGIKKQLINQLTNNLYMKLSHSLIMYNRTKNNRIKNYLHLAELEMLSNYGFKDLIIEQYTKKITSGNLNFMSTLLFHDHLSSYKLNTLGLSLTKDDLSKMESDTIRYAEEYMFYIKLINLSFDLYRAQFQDSFSSNKQILKSLKVRLDLFPVLLFEELTNRYLKMLVIRSHIQFSILKNDTKNSILLIKKALEFIKSEKNFEQLFITDYLMISNLYLNTLNTDKNYPQIIGHLSDMKKVVEINNQPNSIINYKQVYAEILSQILSDEDFHFDNIIEIEKNIIDFINDISNRNPISRYIIQLHFGYYLLCKNRLDEALFFIDNMIKKEVTNHMTNHAVNARIVHILIHYNLNNFNLIQSIAINYIRYINQLDGDFKFEKELISMLKMLSENTTKVEKQKQLLKIKSFTQNHLDSHIFYLRWVELKLSSI